MKKSTFEEHYKVRCFDNLLMVIEMINLYQERAKTVKYLCIMAFYLLNGLPSYIHTHWAYYCIGHFLLIVTEETFNI